MLTSSTYLLAQQPAHFILGEDQFKGIQIYDLIQDNKLNYWIATNEGLFYYDYSNFEKVECSAAKSVSMFNFVKNSHGEIFCHNMNNQVFKIVDRSCTVFYELNSTEKRADIFLAIGNHDELLIVSKVILVLDRQGKFIQRYDKAINYISQALTLDDKSVLFHIGYTNQLIIYTNGKFVQKNMNLTPGVLKLVRLNRDIFGIDLESKKCYKFDPKTFQITNEIRNEILSRSVSLRVYQTGQHLWIAGTLPGTYFIEKDPASSSTIVFEDYFISDVYKDSEGNTLLSTFDKGIIVIPSMQVPDVVATFREDPINSVYSSDQGRLILGSSKGKLLAFDRDFSTLSNEGTRPIEVIAGNKEYLLYDDGIIKLLHISSGKRKEIVKASLKSAVYAKDNVFYLGTNMGVLCLDLSAGEQFTLEPVKELNIRVHRMAYDPFRNELYVSTADGLFLLKKNSIEKIRYKQKDLYPNYLYYSNGEIYISTREDGVLIYHSGQFKRQLLLKKDGQLMAPKKMIVSNGKLIASSSFGLFEFDLQGNYSRSFNTGSGFSNKRVIDFTIHLGDLWVSHSGGFQKVDLDWTTVDPNSIRVRLDRIVINGNELYPINGVKLNKEQRKIQFDFSCPTLKYKELVSFHYRLIGADTSWIPLPREMNQVTFNALSSGEYRFELKAKCQGIQSEVLSFPFIIPKPFYLTWWFFTLSLISFLTIVWLVYRRQLQIQQRKSQQINELYASKLTAIQSQMNPHFIFNSLNSIQDLILKGDVEHSYSYITTFSDLVRRTLNYSEKDFIDFEQEIKLINLYLSLEQLRFKKDFDFEIVTHQIEDLLLPPLLIQPFIENALVHGLLHKEGKKCLKVEFKYDNGLICIIEDNGIGRDAARKIRQRQRGDHESFSSEAIRKRFEILSQVFEEEFGFEYIDLKDSAGNTGTKVIMRIPSRPKF